MSLCWRLFARSAALLKPSCRQFRMEASSSPSQWPCSSCTFLNPLSANTCQICHTRSLPHSQWPCHSCTFLNNLSTSNCQMCGVMQAATPSNLFIVDDDEAKAEADGLVGTKFRPLQQHIENPSPTKCKRPSKETDEEGWVDMKKSAKVAASTSASASCITNSFLRDLHIDRVSRSTAGVEEVQGSPEIGNSSSTNGSNSEKQNAVVLLTYNVWFREDLEVHARMNELGNLIEQHQPHFICFQEVTPNIYEIFRHSNWWTKYQCSISPQSAKMRAYFCIQLSRLPVINFQRSPFRNSIMGRELCRADVDTCGGKQLVIATTHLESPCPAPPKWDQMYSAERVFQANESFNVLKNLPNAIFAGDMNWDDRLDGEPPLPDGWYDVWVKLRPGKVG